MIELVFTGMCEDCECADLELDSLEHCDGTMWWTVRCRHAVACDKMEDKTIDRLKGGGTHE